MLKPPTLPTEGHAPMTSLPTTDPETPTLTVLHAVPPERQADRAPSATPSEAIPNRASSRCAELRLMLVLDNVNC